MELYRKCRPKHLAEVLGQEATVSVLSDKFRTHNLPHSVLLMGPPGTGKTTLAGIIARQLHCGRSDYNEMNTADYRGIDSIRDVRSTMYQAPLEGACRVWTFDECHKMTNDAQNALLKLLEDPPEHVYFILCTTEPDKLLRTIQERCMPLRLGPLKIKDLTILVQNTCEQQGFRLAEEVQEQIVEYAQGSGRMALVLLERVASLKTEEEQMQALAKISLQDEALHLARALCDSRTRWAAVADRLEKLREEDAEQIRWMILGYATTMLLGSRTPGRAYQIINAFRDHFFDCKFAGLAAACYQVVGEQV